VRQLVIKLLNVTQSVQLQANPYRRAVKADMTKPKRA